MVVDIRKISMELLDKKIADYREKNNASPYLFMNEATASELTLQHDFKGTANWSYSIFTYDECNVYLDSLVPYGRVTIR